MTDVSERRGSRSEVGAGATARFPVLGLILILVGLLGFGYLLVNVLSNGPLVRFDEQEVHALHAMAVQQPAWVITLMRFAGFMGQWAIIIIGVVLGLFWFRRRAWREFSMLIAGVGGAELLFQVISNIVGRQRPQFPDPLEVLLVPGFPSGHTLASVTLYGLLLYLILPRVSSRAWRGVLILLTIALVAWIGYGRVFLGSHYPTDVMAGACLGLAWAGFIYPVLDRYWQRRTATSARRSGEWRAAP